MSKLIVQIKRHLPDVVLVISLYLFCLNFAAFKLGDSHEARKELYELYTLGIASSQAFHLVLLLCNILSIILTAQSKRKNFVQTVYILLFSINVLWISWMLM